MHDQRALSSRNDVWTHRKPPTGRLTGTAPTVPTAAASSLRMAVVESCLMVVQAMLVRRSMATMGMRWNVCESKSVERGCEMRGVFRLLSSLSPGVLSLPRHAPSPPSTSWTARRPPCPYTLPSSGHIHTIQMQHTHTPSNSPTRLPSQHTQPANSTHHTIRHRDPSIFSPTTALPSIP